MNDDLRKAIDDAPVMPEIQVAQARFVLGSHWELDLTDPKTMLAAMAGASYVGYLADRLFQAGAINVAEHALLSRVQATAQGVWANACRFLERERAGVGSTA